MSAAAIEDEAAGSCPAGEEIEEIELATEAEDDLTETIQKFRDIVQDVILEDHLRTDPELLRWLRARSMNLQSAEEMLRKSINWRKSNDMETILEWTPPEGFLKDFPFQICGFDIDGDQFGVVTWSKWNIQSFIEAIPVNQGREHLRYFWQCLEVVKQIMRNHSTPDRPIYSGIVVVDMDGLAITQFASKEIIEVILDATRQYEANYPGFLKKAIVVNTPKIFTVLWSMMKPFLSAETLASVEIYGYYDDWKAVLREYLPVEQMPARYGGSNTTVKNYHPSHGYRVEQPVFDEIEVSELVPGTVQAGLKLDLKYDITEPFTKLSWAFRTDDYDVGFGVYYNETEEVVDVCRVDAHVLVQRGSYICERTGTYTVSFDNVSSWIRPKNIYYKINVIPPQDQ